MSKRIAVALAAATVLLLAPALGLEALADERGADPVATPRPPEGVLRYTGPSLSPVPVAQPARRELVMLVGGYQSCSCQDDPMFSSLRTQLEAAGYDVVQFGRDPRFPYDTYGHVAANAAHLRDEVRALSPGYGAVHLVAHSMGGVVADQAFAAGLSRADGVATYVSLAAPHSGSTYARAIELVHAAARDDGGALRSVPLLFGIESSSDAVHDLARLGPVRAPAGVVRFDLREATDLLVPGHDNADPGVPARVLAGAVEGHGGILEDRQAIDLTLRTIAARRVPPDDRPRVVAGAADASGAFLGHILVALVLIAGLAAAGAAICRRVIPGALDLPFLPRAPRRRCP